MKVTTQKNKKISIGYVAITFNEKAKSNIYDGKELVMKTAKMKNIGLYNFRLFLRSIVRVAQSHSIQNLSIEIINI